MDDLERNIRKLREYDDLSESVIAIERLVEDVLRSHEEQMRPKLSCDEGKPVNLSL